jgi:hypothetical protein
LLIFPRVIRGNVKGLSGAEADAKVTLTALFNEQVFLKKPLDYERDAEYSMVILAVDGGAEPLTGSQTLTVRVVDANDNRPMVTVNTLQSASAGTGASVASPGGSTDSHMVDVVENGEPGSFVAHVAVYDADSGPGGLVSFKRIFKFHTCGQKLCLLKYPAQRTHAKRFQTGLEPRYQLLTVSSGSHPLVELNALRSSSFQGCVSTFVIFLWDDVQSVHSSICK